MVLAGVLATVGAALCVVGVFVGGARLVDGMPAASPFLLVAGLLTWALGAGAARCYESAFPPHRECHVCGRPVRLGDAYQKHAATHA
jgi:hypothetical protein